MAKTILLADDSATIRKVVELTFSDTDVRVESVATGAAALSCLDRLRPDLVLADIGMPEPSGYEICRRLKARPDPVPVVLLAGTFESFDAELARACGADGHLLKPFESRVLLEQVEQLLYREGRAAKAIPAGDETPHASGFAPDFIDAVAQAVVRRLAGTAIEDIARQVVPDVAERIVRQRIRELERDEA